MHTRPWRELCKCLTVLCSFPSRRFRKGLIGLTLGTCAHGCGSNFPEPRTTTHANTDYIEVPYLPPAALVEVAGDPPSDHAVWYDGHWVWRSDRYLWKRGGWATNTDALSYAPWKTLVLEDGRLMFAEGTWYDANGHKVPAPKVVKPAQTPPNEVTSEFESAR